MKKVLLSLLAVAALVLSCQNYDDEFASLNSKIAGLESQITSLAELRTAVTGVQSSISALQTAVAAAQAAAVAAGDAAEAAGDANAEAAAANAESIAALATSVAAIAADLVGLQAAIDGATTEADLDALKSELSTTLAALQSLIETNSASIASLILGNSELKDALAKLGVDVDSVLAANASFDGSLSITSASELAYAKSLGNKVSSIRGSVNILVDETNHTGGGDGTGLTAAEVNTVTSLINYVVGDLKIVSDGQLDLSNLVSVSGDYIVIGHDVSDDKLLSVGDDVHFDYDGPYVSKIETADNIYLVSKVKAAKTATAPERIGTTEIDFLSIKKATGLQTVNSTVAGQHTSGGSLTYGPQVDLKGIIVAGTSSATSSLAANNTNATTSIKIGQVPVVKVEGGNKLTTIELRYAADYDATTNPLGSAALGGVDIDATSATSVTVMAATVTGNVDLDVTAAALTSGSSATISFPNLVSAGGFISDALVNSALSNLTTLGSGGLSLAYQTSVALPLLASSTGGITLSKATSFSAPKLARVGSSTATAQGANITANEVEGVVSLPVLTKAGDIAMNKVTSFSAPLAKISGIDIEELATTPAVVTTSIEVASISLYPAANTNPVLANGVTGPATLSTLKLNAQDAVMDLTTFTNATSIDYTGKAVLLGRPATGTLSVSSANTKLTTLKLGGVLETVVVNTNTATSNAAAVTAADGGHTGTALSSITTSGTIESITISNNYDLTNAQLLHTDGVNPSSGLASVVIVSGNPNLTTLKTGVTMISDLSIGNNYKLSNLDLSSITKLPSNFVYGITAMNIDIVGNFADTAVSNETIYKKTNAQPSATAPLSTYTGMTGTVVAATPGVAAYYGQSGIATLKTLFTLLNSIYWTAAARAANAPAYDTYDVTINMNYAYQTSTPDADIKAFADVTEAAFDELLLIQ
jgi:hypothetical protein